MDQQAYDYLLDNEKTHWWFVARREIIATCLKKFIPQKPIDILEIGCGTGGNLKMLSQFGTVTGMENDPYALQQLKKQHINNVIVGELPNNLEKTKKCDLVCLFDVLEHIEEDELAINNIADLLKENSYIALTVPAFNFLWSEHDEIHQHKRRYTRKRIITLLEENNFKILHASYFNFFLFPVIYLVRQLSYLFPKIKITDNKPKSKFINNFLKHLFATEKFIIPFYRLPFGVSIWVLAKYQSLS